MGGQQAYKGHSSPLGEGTWSNSKQGVFHIMTVTWARRKCGHAGFGGTVIACLVDACHDESHGVCTTLRLLGSSTLAAVLVHYAGN